MSEKTLHCTTCAASFRNLNEMYAHFNTDFHMFNVRRRAEGTIAISYDAFTKLEKEKDTGSNMKKILLICKLCSKKFHSVQTLQSHIRSSTHLMLKSKRNKEHDDDNKSMTHPASKKHLATDPNSQGQVNAPISASSDEWKRHSQPEKKLNFGNNSNSALPRSSPQSESSDLERDASERCCLFCGFNSKSFMKNMAHLTQVHSFTIPLQEFCKSKKELILYLSRKINGLICIYCNENTRSFNTLTSLRHHMMNKMHTRFLLSREYQEFYSRNLDEPVSKGTAPKNGNVITIEKNHGDSSRKMVIMSRKEGQFISRKRNVEYYADKHALLKSENEERKAVRQRIMNELRPLIKQENKRTHKKEKRYQKQALMVSLKTNRCIPKGYDGEGEVN